MADEETDARLETGALDTEEKEKEDALAFETVLEKTLLLELDSDDTVEEKELL